MYAFKYHKPSSIEDAAKVFSGADDARYLSGGHTLGRCHKVPPRRRV